MKKIALKKCNYTFPAKYPIPFLTYSSHNAYDIIISPIKLKIFFVIHAFTFMNVNDNSKCLSISLFRPRVAAVSVQAVSWCLSVLVSWSLDVKKVI